MSQSSQAVSTRFRRYSVSKNKDVCSRVSFVLYTHLHRSMNGHTHAYTTHTDTHDGVLPVSVTSWNILLTLINSFGLLFISNTNTIQDGGKATAV